MELLIMRCFSRWAISLVFIAVLPLLSACSETKNADTPEILGTPPKLAYIDVLYEYTFGADGGDNILTYRIVDAPEWLKIESLNGVKPEFRIYGVPALKPGENFNTYEDTPFYFTLEASDGERSQQFTYKFTLQKNKVDFALATLEVKEGEPAEEIGEDVFDKECEIPSLKPKVIDGKTANPIPVFVSLNQPSVSDITLKVILTNGFNEGKELGSRDDTNIRSAQADIDYVSEDHFVTLKAGVQTCLFAVDIFDDSIIEATESFDLTLIEATEGWVEHERPGKAKVNIVDDEPSVDFTGEEIILNEGETSKKYNVTISESIDYPVSVDLYIDKTTTATEEDYALSATTLTYSPGTTNQTFTVEILDDADAVTPTKDLDETIVIKTDVSSIFELTPLKITINEWVNIKQTASSASNKQSHALITDSGGYVVVLNSIDNATKDTEIQLLDRRSDEHDFSIPLADSTIESASPAGDDIPVAMDFMLKGNNNDIVIVLETTGMIGTEHFGAKDIFIRKYRRKSSRDYYEKLWDKQIGSAANDVPMGVFIDPLQNVIVYGYSEGTFPDNTNNGQKDAFVTQFNKDGNQLWTKLIGTSEDDIATGASYNGTSLVISGTTKGALEGTNAGSVDGFIATINSDGTTKGINQFGTVYADELTGMSSYNSLNKVVGYSQGDFTIQSDGVSIDPFAARNSIDGFYTSTNTLDKFVDTVTWGDNNAKETTTAITNLAENSYIGGLTEGTLSGENALLGTDATLIAINSSQLQSEIIWKSQFGTDGDDQVISLDSDIKKIMVLWESINGGVTNYNITPFSVDGKALAK